MVNPIFAIITVKTIPISLGTIGAGDSANGERRRSSIQRTYKLGEGQMEPKETVITYQPEMICLLGVLNL